MRATLLRTTLAATFALLTVLSVPFSVARADTVTITPPRFELFGNPGDIVSEKIKVRNDSTADITYQVAVEDFRAEGEEGSVTFVDPKDSADNFSLARWTTFEPSQFVVPPGQEKILSFTIRIPRAAEPGGRYASVLIRRAGDASPGGAAVESRIGSLILLRVSGSITEKATLESFRPESAFQQFGPIILDARYKNEGNVHISPTGTIVITNLFGKKVKEIPVTPTAVLPDATRIVRTTWDTKNLIGRYTASLVVNYGQNNQTITGSTSFIVFPLYLLVVIVVAVLLLYVMITKRKGLKRFINRLTRD
jgi:hypothetical protein